MRQLHNDKQNIAWFKLADFVERGEKERALGVLRLLTHSFEDTALALQLEADILSAFHEGIAVERYRSAAQAYHASNRYMHALGMYEHVGAISDLTYHDIVRMIELAHVLVLPKKIIALYKKIITYPEAMANKDVLKTMMQESCRALDKDSAVVLQEVMQTLPI